VQDYFDYCVWATSHLECLQLIDGVKKMKLSKKDLTSLPIIVLVAANVLPLYGVCFLGWNAFHIVLLYWAENLAIGFYNVLKIAAARVEHPVLHLSKLFFIPFFIVHYGGFMAVHGFFVLALAKQAEGQSFAGPSLGKETWPCFFVFIQMLINVIRHIFSIIPSQMKLAILALFISHGFSFVYNYLLKGEYVTARPSELMNKPYSRVVVLHIAIIAGGFFVMALGSPLPLLIVIVIGKIILDIKMHLREHKKAKAASPETA
jgi:hypothetical protein